MRWVPWAMALSGYVARESVSHLEYMAWSVVVSGWLSVGEW